MPRNIPADEIVRIYDRESQNLSDFSARMSELCRYVWAGSLATFFALLLAAKDTRAFEFYAANRLLMLIAVGLGSAAFIFDYLQALSAFRNADIFIDWVENAPSYEESKYRKLLKNEWLRWNRRFFVAKNVCAVLTATLLGGAVIRYAFG